jgi:hypothetical protein
VLILSSCAAILTTPTKQPGYQYQRTWTIAISAANARTMKGR